MYFRVTILLLVLGLTGCGQQPADVVKSASASISGSEPAVISAVRILPESPRSDTTLEAEVLFQGKQTKQLYYQWVRNGTPLAGFSDPTLPSGELDRGDYISVRVWTKQPGGEKNQRESEVVMIGNSPPIIKRVSIEPDPPISGDALEMTAISKDWDDDEVAFTCEWIVNGETVAGAEDTFLASGHFRRGDKVQVAVTPYDRDSTGKPKLSPAVVVLNGAPRIVSEPPEFSDSGVYRYAIRAEDPDGDAIHFSLSGQPPAGMEIDPGTGVVIWPVTASEQEVTYTFEVVAEDPNGAKCIQTVTMTSTPASGQVSEGEMMMPGTVNRVAEHEGEVGLSKIFDSNERTPTGQRDDSMKHGMERSGRRDMGNRDGFTITELLIVLVIAVAAAAIAMPALSHWQSAQQLSGAARDLASSFQVAKMEAAKRNRFCTITFNLPIGSTTFSYVVYVDTDRDLEYDNDEPIIKRIDFSRSYYKNVEFDTSKGGGDGISFDNNDNFRPSIAFNPRGLPINNDQNIIENNENSVFIKDNKGNFRQIKVSPSGHVQIP